MKVTQMYQAEDGQGFNSPLDCILYDLQLIFKGGGSRGIFPKAELTSLLECKQCRDLLREYMDIVDTASVRPDYQQ
jgi:hypothetical protein